MGYAENQYAAKQLSNNIREITRTKAQEEKARVAIRNLRQNFLMSFTEIAAVTGMSRKTVIRIACNK